MHSFARHRPSRASKASATETKGLVLNQDGSGTPRGPCGPRRRR